MGNWLISQNRISMDVKENLPKVQDVPTHWIKPKFTAMPHMYKMNIYNWMKSSFKKKKRKVMQRMWRHIYEDGIWRLLRKNAEIYEFTKQPNIIQRQKSRQFQWAGNIARMQDNRLPKWAFAVRHTTRRSFSKAQNRWVNDVRRETQKIWALTSERRQPWTEDSGGRPSHF